MEFERSLRANYERLGVDFVDALISVWGGVIDEEHTVPARFFRCPFAKDRDVRIDPVSYWCELSIGIIENFWVLIGHRAPLVVYQTLNAYGLCFEKSGIYSRRATPDVPNPGARRIFDADVERIPHGKDLPRSIFGVIENVDRRVIVSAHLRQGRNRGRWPEHGRIRLLPVSE